MPAREENPSLSGAGVYYAPGVETCQQEYERDDKSRQVAPPTISSRSTRFQSFLISQGAACSIRAFKNYKKKLAGKLRGSIASAGRYLKQHELTMRKVFSFSEHATSGKR